VEAVTEMSEEEESYETIKAEAVTEMSEVKESYEIGKKSGGCHQDD